MSYALHLKYLLGLILTKCTVTGAASNRQKLILVSLDGFRWDFDKKGHTPNLDRLRSHGVSVDYVQNVFPTSTIPNHQSIVTGLYPENHGMIDNLMYNRTDGSVFNPDNSESNWWGEAIPVWITSEEQGLKSGVCFWPSFNVSYNGRQPMYLPSDIYGIPYGFVSQNVMPMSRRVNLVVEWMKVPHDVDFAALYIDEPDTTCHGTSPDPEDAENEHKLRSVIEEVDGFVGQLLARLQVENLLEITNILVIGDHGQTTITSSSVFNIDEFVDTKRYVDFIGGSANKFLYVKDGYVEFVYKKLVKAHPQISVFLKDNIPEELRVRRNKRTGDILLLPNSGWTIIHDLDPEPVFRKPFRRGEHGYASSVRSMNPAFYAIGPAFHKGVRKTYVNTVDVYALMCKILNIVPRQHNGSLEMWTGMLKDLS